VIDILGGCVKEEEKLKCVACVQSTSGSSVRGVTANDSIGVAVQRLMTK